MGREEGLVMEYGDVEERRYEYTYKNKVWGGRKGYVGEMWRIRDAMFFYIFISTHELTLVCYSCVRIVFSSALL